MSAEVAVREAIADDFVAIAEIYNHYISETVVTFEVDPVSADEMRSRYDRVIEHGFPWLVAVVDDEEVAGYAYAAQWHQRAAYRFSAEITVYLSPNHTGRGIGSALYADLIDRLTAKGIHTIIGGVALPNPASVVLHEKFGMQRAAYYRQVGFKFDRWIDVGYWQRILSE